MVGKKQKSEQTKLTNDMDDKDPTHKKQQKAVSDKVFREKRDIKRDIKLAEGLATKLGIKVTNQEAKKLRRKLHGNSW